MIEFVRALLQSYAIFALDWLRRWLATTFATLAAWPPFASDDAMNARFLTTQLRAAKLIDADATVQSSSIESFAHRGLGGDVRRVVVKVLNDRSSDAVSQLSLIVKRSDPSRVGRFRAMFGGSWREGRFYESDVALRFGELVERPLFARGSALLGEFIVLQKDFNTLGGQPLNKLLGDQVFGAKLAGDKALAAVALLERLYVRVADVHAKNWQSAELLDKAWLRGVDWRLGRGQERWDVALQHTKTLWQTAKTFHANGPVVMRPRLVALIERSLQASSFQRFVQDMKSESFTLVHGDFHAQNMFSMKDGTFRLVDWSEFGVGAGANDIGQCIVSDLHRDLFRAHGRKLLRAYWLRLVECGVDDYPYERCEAEFAALTIKRWIFFDCLLAGFGAVLPSVLTQYFLDQLEAFIVEFGDIDGTYPLGLMAVLC